MLTTAENEKFTRVGPGTPMGELLRRYWHPIAAVAEMDEAGIKSHVGFRLKLRWTGWG